MIQYPSSFPIGEIKNVIDIVRNGQIKDKVKEFAHDVWVIQGYSQSALLGSPATEFALISAPENFDALVELEKIAAAYDASATSAAPQSAISDAVWKFIAKWAMEQLLAILEKQFTK